MPRRDGRELHRRSSLTGLRSIDETGEDMGEHAMLRVLHFGLGEIGIGIARESAASGRLQSVAAVDLDAAKVGKPLGALWGGSGGVPVRSTLAEALAEARGIDIAFHCAGSHIDA